jgi:hypothetical protein
MLKNALMTARILWGALLMSVGLYLVVLQVVSLPPAPTDPALAAAFAVIAVTLAVTSVLLPRVVHRNLLKQVQLEVSEELDAGAFAGFYREATARQRVITDREAAHRAAWASFLAPHILRLALSEAVALLGFVLAFLGFQPLVWASFFAAGTVLLAIRFPTERSIVAPLEEAFRAKIVDDGAQRA